MLTFFTEIIALDSNSAPSDFRVRSMIGCNICV